MTDEQPDVQTISIAAAQTRLLVQLQQGAAAAQEKVTLALAMILAGSGIENAEVLHLNPENNTISLVVR